MMYRFCFVLLFAMSLGAELSAQSFSLDSSFQPFFNIRQPNNSGGIIKIWEDSTNGKTYVVGSFSFAIGQVFNNGFTIMNQNGSRDASFVGNTSVAGWGNVFSINDTALLISSSNGSYRIIDHLGSNIWGNWYLNYIKTAKCVQGVQPFFFKNGSSLMAKGLGSPGSCKIINPPDTFPHRYIVKVDSLGWWDSTFTQDANYDPRGFVAYDSNRILIYGSTSKFTEYDNIKVDGLCRIYHDGTLDTTFHNPLLNSPNSLFFDIGPIEADGGFFIKGNFLLKGSATKVHSLVRLNADGSLDTNFMNDSGPIDTNGFFGDVYTLAPTPDHGYLVGGLFNKYQGHPVNTLAKIDSTGKIETQYFTSRGPDSSNISGNGMQLITQILPSKFGGYYVVGDFLKWDNQPSQPIVRLTDLVVGVAENQKLTLAKVQVYPNPTKEKVNVRLMSNQQLNTIRLYDLLGRTQSISYQKKQNGNYVIDISDLPQMVSIYCECS